MPRRAASLALVALLAAGAGCGGSDESQGSARGSSASPAAAARATGVKLVKVGSFSSPVYVTAPPGDTSRLFVVEQAGRIRVMRNGQLLGKPFLDIRGRVESGGERGLLSMAFPPDYASSRLFYVYFTDHSGDIRIQQFKRSAGNANVADPGSRKDVLRVGHRTYPNHNGGQLQFGPDGMLYSAFGDGGGAGDPFRSGQRLDTLLAKLIRIDPRPGGRATGDLVLWTAQRVPLQLRPQDRRPDDRRRRAVRVRGGRLPHRPRQGRQLRLERLRGFPPLPLRERSGRRQAQAGPEPR